MKPKDWRRSSAGPYLRRLPRLKHFRGSWLHRRLGDRFMRPEVWQPGRESFAGGISVGMFFSMMPLPFQMLASGCIAMITRVNIPAAIAATWFSNPLTTPFLLYGQYKLGCWILGKAATAPANESVLSLISSAPLPLLTGALITGVTASLLSYPVALWGWDFVISRCLNRQYKISRKHTSE